MYSPPINPDELIYNPPAREPEKDNREKQRLAFIGDTLIQIGQKIAQLRFDQPLLQHEKRRLIEEIGVLEKMQINEWSYVVSKAKACLFSIQDKMRTIYDRLMLTQKAISNFVPGQRNIYELCGRYEFVKRYAKTWVEWPNNLSNVTFQQFQSYPEFIAKKENSFPPRMQITLLPNNPLIIEMAQDHWKVYLGLEHENATLKASIASLVQLRSDIEGFHQKITQAFKRMVIVDHFNQILKGMEIYEYTMRIACLHLLENRNVQEDLKSGFVAEANDVLKLMVSVALATNSFKEEFSK